MGAVSSTEMVVATYQTIQHHNTENHIMNLSL